MNISADLRKKLLARTKMIADKYVLQLDSGLVTAHNQAFIGLYLQHAANILSDPQMSKKSYQLLEAAKMTVDFFPLQNISIFGHVLHNIIALNLAQGWKPSSKKMESILKELQKKSDEPHIFELIQGATGIGRTFYYNSQVKDWTKNYLKKHSFEINGLQGYLCHPLFSFEDQLPSEEKKLPRFNTGFAHGLSGVLTYHSQNSDEVMAFPIAKTLLMIAQNNPQQNIDCVWPILSPTHQNQFHSQNAWCYGDLGVGFSFITFAKSFPHNELSSELLMIGKDKVRNSLEITNPIFSSNDSHFCHGMAGIVQVAKRTFELTKEDVFACKTIEWLEKMLGGHSVPYERSGKKNYIEILEGDLGPGFAILSFLLEEDLKWDNLFLTSAP